MNLSDWTFFMDGFEPLPCRAPCTMYSVLLENGKIPDPFYGVNEQTLRHLGERDCAFETEFTVDARDLEKEYQELEFSGLDTVCRILLNGSLVGRTKNMHRTYVFPVKDRLVPGKNTLRLEFSSPMAYFREAQRRHYLYMNDGDTVPGTAHLRKAMFESGWDWAPTLPDMGITRPVELRSFDGGRLERVLVSQKHRGGEVDVSVRADVLSGSEYEVYVNLDGQRVRATAGEAVVHIEHPRLWWVRGYGEQPLYPLETELWVGGTCVDRKTMRIGLRTLTVSTEKDADGKGSEFCFVINGIKIFSMGANFVPMDSLLTRITPDRLENLVNQAAAANFNTLRIWGGGYYPEDTFYDLCDEKGILVWQDFMVACANIWLTTDMEQEFTCEAVDNLSRLQHHASLGLLCGNNEMEGMILGGCQNTELVHMDYLRLYEHLLPELCGAYAPDTFYWPSSPSSGGSFDDPGCPSRGDTHYWMVWHGGLPFTAYRENSFRFCSEYGFESLPSMKTVETFSAPEDRNLLSRVMDDHQKCRTGNEKLLRYLADYYLYPSRFEDLVYASQLMQAEAIESAVEHFRRQRGYCMGSTYWQFNDCWPVASWASIDYFGRWKALHYAAKRFYAPVAMGLFLENGTLTVNIANETRQAFRGAVRLYLCRGDRTVLDEQRCEVTVEALSSLDVLRRKVDAADVYDTYLYADLYDASGNFLTRRTQLLVPPKHFSWRKPTVTVTAEDIPGGVAFRVSADVFAKNVYLDFRDRDLVLSDNYFDLTAPKAYTVTAQTQASAAELLPQLTVKTVYDIR